MHWSGCVNLIALGLAAASGYVVGYLWHHSLWLATGAAMLVYILTPVLIGLVWGIITRLELKLTLRKLKRGQ